MTEVRVLNILNEREVGGAQLHAVWVASQLKRQGIKTIVVIPTGCGGIAPLLQDLKIPFYEVSQLHRIRQSYNPAIHLRWAVSYWPCIYRLMRIIRKEGINIVHQNGILHTQGVVAGRLAGKKVLWHLHGMASPMLGSLVRPLVPVLAHTILVNSQKTARAYFDVSVPTPPGRLKLVYPPVDANRFHCAPGHRLREELGIPLSAPLIGMVGNINPLKGHLDFIRAASIICQSIPSSRFVIVGKVLATRQSYYRRLTQEVGRLHLQDRLHFVGYRSDIPEVLAELDVFVNPSHSEGFGMTVSEAMAAARPIVATDVGGAREMLPDSSYGLVIELGQPQAIADSVLYLVSNPDQAKKMAARAAIRAAEKFSLEECARNHKQIYEELVNLSAARRDNFSIGDRGDINGSGQ